MWHTEASGDEARAFVRKRHLSIIVDQHRSSPAITAIGAGCAALAGTGPKRDRSDWQKEVAGDAGRHEQRVWNWRARRSD
ncbi:hypothetical protein M3553_21445 [Bacillus subtilis]|nr:hypothetical protein [Bacillus subtilis]